MMKNAVLATVCLLSCILVTACSSGERIAFVSDRDGNKEIYVMNADGGDVVRLTEHPASDIYPSWSPDGEHIAFASDRDGNWEIYSMNADGSNVARLTDHPAYDTCPSWSPDGKHIVFSRGSTPYMTEADGRRRLVDLYIRQASESPICLMDDDGGEVTPITNLPPWIAPPLCPSWSPDGERIALVPCEMYHDPEARKNYIDCEGGNVCAANTDGSEFTCLTSFSFLSDGASSVHRPSWSPDGKRIAFVMRNDRVRVVNVDGSGVRGLTSYGDREHHPSWSPDGKHIAFASDRDGNWEIYRIKPDGSELTRLTDHPANDDYPSWSPR